MAALERETQDVRQDIHKEVGQIGQPVTTYDQSYYGSDNSYDYGAYGYSETPPESAPAITEASTPAPETVSGSHEYSGDAAAPSTPEAPPAATLPVVMSAQGTIPTHFPSPAAREAESEQASL
jgi:hypothetical protein